MRYLSFLLLVIFITSNVSLAFAQEEASSAAKATESATPTSLYTLPYPGMLPDNPFYSVKILRDHIVLFLISDPVKKAEFKLLQADKRLQAGVYLWRKDKEKADLVISTISKGENYFEQALEDTRQAKREGRDIGALAGDLAQSSRKHTQILSALQEEMPEQYTPALDTLRSRTESFTKSAVSFN